MSLFYYKVNEDKLEDENVERFGNQVKNVCDYLSKRYSLEDKTAFCSFGFVQQDFSNEKVTLKITFKSVCGNMPTSDKYDTMKL